MFAERFEMRPAHAIETQRVTLAVVLTLALATGTTTTLFSIVSKVLFTPFAFEAPETIVFIWSRNEGLPRVRAPLTFTE